MADPAISLKQARGEQIRVRGLVQGVGFRPTVYRLAQQMALNGEVFNDGEGVVILLQADARDIDRFVGSLKRECPPLARIDAVERAPYRGTLKTPGFTIRSSQQGNVHTGIVPDATTCDDCLADINQFGNRRWRYAFANCTHCGPRLSIVQDIPYDRAHTSMAQFELCASCREEYENPADRRFHAQPNACPDCGPLLILTDKDGNEIECADMTAEAVRLIREGYILAIKGVGGFQLACDAGNDSAVSTLRSRKKRPHKAFALMARDEVQINDYCRLSMIEVDALRSTAAPIVILDCRDAGKRLAAGIAPGQNSYGFMLPFSPLHHLLMQALEWPIVLTSGNISEEPQCIDNRQALDRLGAIADYFVLHNRDIVNRVDDSVLRVIDGSPMPYRRGRGYAPAPIAMPSDFGTGGEILACGGELKNTFCLLKDGQAILSQHIGNLTNTLAYEDYRHNLALYKRLFQFDPQGIAVDQHPEYLSTRYGTGLGAEKDLPLVEVQHHHAHIASCLVDNGWEISRGPVIGVALDGIGFGDDGTIWGGEFGLVDYAEFERLARLKPVPMPGANRAALEPWRNTYAQLRSLPDWEQLADRYATLDLLRYLRQKPLELVDRMLQAQINSPLTSSCGRLFDGFAAALGICADSVSYEGQAAIELEALMQPGDLSSNSAYAFALEKNELLEISPEPVWHALLNDLQQQQTKSMISARFHRGLAEIIVEVVDRLRLDTNVSTVALSGGVFQNAHLLRMVNNGLKARNFEVLLHRQVPCNDGGLALGQAAVAFVRLQQGDTK